jgi:hypothetical protein
MQQRRFAIAALAAAFTVATLLAPAMAQTQERTASAKRHADRPAVRTPSTGTKIVCSKTGCRAVPANCKVTMEQTWEGPTGYEIVDCP